MSEWNIWKAAFDLVTLKNDGDSLEMRGATEHGLDSSFSNFEIFWRYHVVPATNRPANIEFRPNVSTAVSKVATLNHSLFIDLVNAADVNRRAIMTHLGG